MPEEEEKEQEIGNVFEKIMKENFPNLVKEIDVQVQEAQRGPDKMDAKRSSPKHIIIKMLQVKDKERILKTVRKKAVSYLQGCSHKTVCQFLKRNFAG